VLSLPLSGCGLRLDDRAVHIAVGLRLGANICEPHQCPCGATVDANLKLKGYMDCCAKADLAGLCGIMLLMISSGGLFPRLTSLQPKSRQFCLKLTASGQTVSHSFHGRTEDVPRETTQ